MTAKQRSKIARQNGAKAAGAKSPQGIQNSSNNATRHGLLSKVLVLSTESQTKFDELLTMYLEKFQPQDGVETNLVYEMVAAKWRQQRVWMAETTALELDIGDQQIDIQEHEAQTREKLDMTAPEQIAMGYSKLANNEKTLELFLRYETSYSRMHDRAVRELFRLREKLHWRNEANPAGSISLHAAGERKASGLQDATCGESAAYKELPNHPETPAENLDSGEKRSQPAQVASQRKDHPTEITEIVASDTDGHHLKSEPIEDSWP